MQSIHMPRVNARYWLAILLASIFGTNLGDLYAHESGLGIGLGLILLAVLTACVFFAERVNAYRTEIFYWLVIIIIRTGATNIADYTKHVIPIEILTVIVGVVLGLLAWRLHAMGRRGGEADTGDRLPATGSLYWVAMLGAGIFGTLAGDWAQHLIGRGEASVALCVMLGTILAVRGLGAGNALSYWATLAVGRSAGTAIGDWLAEGKEVALGLPPATLLSGTAFILVLLLVRSKRTPEVATA